MAVVLLAGCHVAVSLGGAGRRLCRSCARNEFSLDFITEMYRHQRQQRRPKRKKKLLDFSRVAFDCWSPQKGLTSHL